MSSNSTYEQVMLCHYRLGHPNFPYLKHLFLALFKGWDCSSFQCENHFLSKSNCSTCVSKLYHPSKPLYLIQSDVCRPSKVETLSQKNGLWHSLKIIHNHPGFFWYMRNLKSKNCLKCSITWLKIIFTQG